MRAVFILILSIIFCLGFFSPPRYVIFLTIIKDIYLHFIVFYIYTFLFCLLLPRFKFKALLVLMLFSVMSLGVEVLQYKVFNRSFSVLDATYSLKGALLGFVSYLYLIYLSKAVKASS